MRRIAAIAVTILLIFSLVFSVSAANQATSVSAYATVSRDGSCQISINATLQIDQSSDDLTFPVPENAKSITLNGSRVRAAKQDGFRHISLKRLLGGMAGTFSITVNYTLDDVIHATEDGLLQMQIPLLSGFAYPVQRIEFSVTLPGEVPVNPAFSSGYHQANIEKDLTYSVSGSVITGSSSKALKDHETLTMLMTVSEEMFPQTAVALPDLDLIHTAMLVLGALALLYWLLFLRTRPMLPIVSPNAPEGRTAGELVSVLTLKGADLTAMIFSWAQLGYLLIRMDRHGRVTVIRQMDMGNERSAFEQRCFKKLFSRREQVDTSSNFYADLSMHIAKMTPNIAPFVRRRTGNPNIFRGLAATAGALCGVAVGIAISAGAALQWLLVIVLAGLGGVSSWLIHRWAYSLFLLDKRPLWLGLGLSGLWILLGILTGLWQMTLLVSIGQLLAGLLAAYGGRRTDAGRQARAQTLGLRRYLRTADKANLALLSQTNPDFFFDLAPYALALGVDQAFAKRFGKTQLEGCPYLVAEGASCKTALDWSASMRKAVDAMEARRRGRHTEKIVNIIRSFMK